MRNRVVSVRSVLSVLGTSLCILAGGAAAQEKTPSLAGTWVYDAERTKAEEAKKISDEPAFSRDDRPRNRSTAASGVATGVPGAGRPELGALAMYSRALPELVIVQTDSTVTISDPSGLPRSYRFDGRKSLEPLLGGGPDSLEIVARWRGGKLTTERKLGKLGTVREEYSVEPKTQALIVDVRLSGPQIVPPLEQRRYYKAKP